MPKPDTRTPSHYLKPKPSKSISRATGGTEPGFTLNKLRHDDFHEICGLTQDVKIHRPDSTTGRLVGFKVVTPDETVGTVTGYAVDADSDEVSRFARVDGRLYHENSLRPIFAVPPDATHVH